MSHILQLLVVLTVVLTAAKASGALARRAGQPAVFGELLIGLVLGPTALNLLGSGIFSGEDIMRTVKDLAELGVILLMFLAGFETDLKEMRKVGTAALVGAAGGVLLPLLAGTGLSMAFGFGFTEAVFIGTVLTATSVSISAETLLELGQMRSKEGTTILGAAVIDDVMGIVVLSLVVALSTGTGGAGSVSLLFLKMGLYFAGALVCARFVPGLLRRIEALPVGEALLTGALAICFVYAFFAEYLGSVAPITGAYIAGVVVGQSDLRDRLLQKLEALAHSFFTPIFFVSIGLEANARHLGASALFAGLITLIAIVTKIAGSGFAVRLVGFSPKESLRVGIGMISRGEVALIAAAIGLTNKVIDNDIFSIMIVMTLVTTLVTPILLRAAFPKSSGTPGGEAGPASENLHGVGLA